MMVDPTTNKGDRINKDEWSMQFKNDKRNEKKRVTDAVMSD
jgi:hypothetical protein